MDQLDTLRSVKKRYEIDNKEYGRDPTEQVTLLCSFVKRENIMTNLKKYLLKIICYLISWMVLNKILFYLNYARKSITIQCIEREMKFSQSPKPQSI